MKEKDRRGYTLIELVVCIFLLAIICPSIYSFYITNIKYCYESIRNMEIEQQVRIAMSYIDRILHNTYEDEVRIMNGTIGGTYLIIKDQMFDLKGTTLRVEYNYNSGIIRKNPLAENIIRFEAYKNGNLLTVIIGGGIDEEAFSLSSEVFLISRDEGQNESAIK